MKPAPIPESIVNRMFVLPNDEIDFSTTKISAIEGEIVTSTYQVKPSDIDMVNHTNNVVYVRMVLDSFQTDVGIKQIDVNFLNQSFEDDLLTINTQTINAEKYLFEVTNIEGRAVCRLQLERGFRQ